MKIKYLFVIVLLFIILLTSCSKIVKLKYNEDGNLSDGNVEYKFAPIGYEPTNQGDEYALINTELKESLYKIGNIDPKQWLTTEYSGSATLVYYNSKINLPTLSEMNPSLCYICEQDDNTYSIYTLDKNSNENDLYAINYIIKSINDNSIEKEIWPRADILTSYHLKFYSPEWPAIYYDVIYALSSENCYIYDKVNSKCIKIDEVLKSYYNNLLENEN